VLITMRAAEPGPCVDAETLMSLFNLTRTEARVGAALSTGAGVTEIAARFDVGEETVRTHVKRLLDKAGVANQREFLAMLVLLPPVNGDGEETRRTVVQLPTPAGRREADRHNPPARCAVLSFGGPRAQATRRRP
jgi:DNA-binding CsgD family transcriptional regulator